MGEKTLNFSELTNRELYLKYEHHVDRQLLAFRAGNVSAAKSHGHAWVAILDELFRREDSAVAEAYGHNPLDRRKK
jgi:hypothetical protein